MARKPKPVKDNSERYLLTYSDLMNLLLILFIILFAMSQVDNKKAQLFAEALGKGFNGPYASVLTATGSKPGGVSSKASSSAGQAATAAVSIASQYDKLYQELLNLIKKNGLENKVVVQLNKNGVVISLNNNVLFPSGVAELSNNSVNLVVSLGNTIKNVDYSQIIIEGHTDTDPIHNSKFQDNRTLSTERANNVLRVMTARCGIPQKKICSMGYGEYRPVAPNDTEANKAKNRRVVITILKPEFSADAVISASTVSNAMATVASSASSRTSSAVFSH